MDLWTEARNAYKFKGTNPVITHSPCQQWSKLKAFAKHDQLSKDLSHFCFQRVLDNGGIFEHPAGSSFFRSVGVASKVVSIDQFWWNHQVRKRTYLYFNGCKPLQTPLRLYQKCRDFDNLTKFQRNNTPIDFAAWLTSCIYTSDLNPDYNG